MDTTPPIHARVEAGWQKVRADGRVRPELLEAAYAEPRLRQLFPWTGMGELHFSRCAEQRLARAPSHSLTRSQLNASTWGNGLRARPRRPRRTPRHCR
ncbi:DUF6193 family natural product biosynthesis protein [Streptomyces lydicus]